MKSGVYLSPDGYDLVVYSVNEKLYRPDTIILEAGYYDLGNKWVVEVMFRGWHYLGDL